MVRRRRDTWCALLVAAVAVLITGFFLSTYVIHRFAVPLGWDAPGYAWRTTIARATGLASLPSALPPPGPVNPGRPATVALTAMLSTLTGLSPLRVGEVLPAVMAAAAGLAAGGFVAGLLRRGAWTIVTVAFAVGTSTFMVHVINVEQYQDNAVAMAVFVASATAIVLAVWDRRASLAACLLLSGVAVVHWNFFEVAAAVLVLFALLYVPTSARAARGHPAWTWLRTPTARLLAICAGAAALGAVVIAGVLTAALPSALLVAEQFADKLRRDLPAYHLPWTLVAAAAGVLTLAGPSAEEGDDAPRVRALLAFCLAWCEVTLIAFVVQRLGRSVPTHRLLAFDLAIPILGVLAILWVGSWLARHGGVARALGVAFVVAAVGGSAWIALGQWWDFRPVMRPGLVDDAAGAARYLDGAHIDPDRPVVVLVDDRSQRAWSVIWLAGHTIRSQMPAERIPNLFLYVGTAADYLARKPSTLPIGGSRSGGIVPIRYDGLSAFYFRPVASTYGRDPVVLMLRSGNQGFGAFAAANPGAVVSPGVAVVTGAPTEVRTLPVVEAGPTTWVHFATGAIVALAVLWVVGWGWASLAFGGRLDPVALASLTPAVGAAVTVVGSVLLNRVGVPVRGVGAVAIPAILATAGWAVWTWRRPAAGATGASTRMRVTNRTS